MRRLISDDSGAVAVVVALLSVALLGFGAIVIDAGQLYAERRELQNGADAGALAVAQTCAAGGCDAASAAALVEEAYVYANANAEDGASNIEEVCGDGVYGLAACDDPPSEVAGDGYVMVRTRTGDQEAGASVVPAALGRVLVEDYEGKTIHARAVAAWGAATGAESDIPVTMSACEWNEFTGEGDALAPAPPYTEEWLTNYGPTYERVFYTHSVSSQVPVGTETSCPATSPGGDAAGSFGWLAEPDDSGVSNGQDDDCSVETSISEDGENGYDNQPGNTVPTPCRQDFPPAGTTVFLPVFDYFKVGTTVNGNGGGRNVWYHIEGYAAFFITGYNLQLPNQGDEPSLVTGQAPCSGQQRCISGFFTAGLVPGSGRVGSGAVSYGASIVQLVG